MNVGVEEYRIRGRRLITNGQIRNVQQEAVVFNQMSVLFWTAIPNYQSVTFTSYYSFVPNKQWLRIWDWQKLILGTPIRRLFNYNDRHTFSFKCNSYMKTHFTYSWIVGYVLDKNTENIMFLYAKYLVIYNVHFKELPTYIFPSVFVNVLVTRGKGLL
jgi:hypothetical protein